MQPNEILVLMKGFFKGKQPAEVLENFAEQTPGTLLKESLDVVDFVVYLEDEMGREIDMNRLGEALRTSTFADLSTRISSMLAESG